MMENKQITQQFLDNLFVNEEKAFEVLAEDVKVNWPGFGMEDIVGKENLRKFFNEGGPDKVLDQQISNLVAEGNVVVADGTIVTEKDGKVETSYFADVYTLNDGKIVSLISYMVMNQPNNL